MRNLKRALSLALASIMVMGLMVVGTSAASYPDVDANDNLAAIEVLKMVGIMEGDEKGNFNPDKMVTRNEMAVVMVNLLGLTPGGSSPFTDVPSWAQPYVAACYNNDIIAGVSATEFNGDANVTAVQAGLMVMKALGYFGYQGEFGDSWKLAVVKQADKIDLYRGVNAYTDQDMTRNNVARMVLNSLECTVQVVTEQGGLNVSGEGIAVTEKPTYKYEDAKNRDDWDYEHGTKTTGLTGAQEDQRDSLQLCEKLYSKDLRKNGDVSDEFGRSCTEWTYQETSIKNPKASDLTYTKEVKLKDIYKDLGLSSALEAKEVKFWLDGQDEDATTLNDNGDTPKNLKDLGLSSATDNKIGGNGTVIEVYYDRDATDKAVIAMYNYYLAKADADYDEDDEELDVSIWSNIKQSATLKAEDFETIKNVQEDDYLVVTIADEEVKSVAPANVIEDAVVSKARNEDYVVADGTEYTYHNVSYDKAADEDEALGRDFMIGDKKYDWNDSGYNLYLDPNGYVLGVEGYDAGVNLDDYLFVKTTASDKIDYRAKVMFMDGTTRTVYVDKVDGDDVDETNWATVTDNTFYKFKTDKDDNYELTLVPNTDTGKEVEQGVVEDNGTIESGAKPIKDDGVVKNLTGNSSTVFIAKDKVYTGVKNAPKIDTKGDVYYMTDDDGRLMLVYTEKKGGSTANSDDIVFILSNKPAVMEDDGTEYYVYDVIMDGEKTTLEVNDDDSLAPGVYEVDTYTDGRADLSSKLSGKADLADILSEISAASYKDGTLTLGNESYILADGVKIFTIDGRTVKTISASGVKKAVADDGFEYAAVVYENDDKDEVVTVYLSKANF